MNWSELLRKHAVAAGRKKRNNAIEFGSAPKVILMPRRLSRIRISEAEGQPFTLGKADREKVEQAYGHSLSAEIWQQIIDATSEFTIEAPSVSTSAPLKAT